MEKYQSAISSAEEEKMEPKLGDYVSGKVAERDPDGQNQTHEGVIVGEGEDNKEWKVVDPGKDKDYFGDPLAPDYNVRNIHKEGARIIPVPSNKEKHVREVKEQLQSNI